MNRRNRAYRIYRVASAEGGLPKGATPVDRKKLKEALEKALEYFKNKRVH